jgi:hypothetical protein
MITLVPGQRALFFIQDEAFYLSIENWGSYELITKNNDIYS